jgi:uncharacterized protein
MNSNQGTVLLELLQQKRGQILEIARRHGVGRVSVFGSAARGDAGPESDIDFQIEVTGSTTPWFPGGIVIELEELLKRRVEIVEPDALRASVRDRILREAVPL